MSQRISALKNPDGSFDVNFPFHADAVNAFKDGFNATPVRDPITNQFSYWAVAPDGAKFTAADKAEGIQSLSGKLEKFVESWEPAIDAHCRSADAAKAYVDAYNADPAKHLPGIKLDVKSGKVAVYTVMPDGAPALVKAASDVLSAEGRYVAFRQEANPQDPSKPITKGGYYALEVSDTKDPTTAITIAAGAIAKHMTQSMAAGQAAAEAAVNHKHPAMRVFSSSVAPDPKKPSVRSAAVFVSCALDFEANKILKDAGGKWSAPSYTDKQNVKGGYAFATDAASMEKLNTALGALTKHFDSLAVPAALDRPGLSDRAIAVIGAIKAPALNAPAADIQAFADRSASATKILENTFSPQERAAIQNLDAAAIKTSGQSRLAALPPETFKAVKTAIGAVATAKQTYDAGRLAQANEAIKTHAQAVGR